MYNLPLYSSTSSSSCESWPPPPPLNIVVKATSSAKKVAVNSKKCANLSSSDSSGNSVKIRVNTQKKFSRQNSPAVLTPATVTINGMHASRVNNSSIIFLGDCEMPITKTSSDTKTSGSDSVGVNASKKSVDYTQKIQIRSASVGESNQRFAEINQQRSRWVVDPNYLHRFHWKLKSFHLEKKDFCVTLKEKRNKRKIDSNFNDNHIWFKDENEDEIWFSFLFSEKIIECLEDDEDLNFDDEYRSLQTTWMFLV